MSNPFLFGSNFDGASPWGFDSVVGAPTSAVWDEGNLGALRPSPGHMLVAGGAAAAKYVQVLDPDKDFLNTPHKFVLAWKIDAAELTAYGAGPTKKIVDLGCDSFYLAKVGSDWKYKLTVGARGPFFEPESSYIYAPGSLAFVEINSYGSELDRLDWSLNGTDWMTSSPNHSLYTGFKFGAV